MKHPPAWKIRKNKDMGEEIALLRQQKTELMEVVEIAQHTLQEVINNDKKNFAAINDLRRFKKVIAKIKEFDNFNEHLKYCNESVEKMPKWKQEALGKEAQND